MTATVLTMKERSSTATSLYSSGGTVTNGSAFDVGAFDMRSGGASNAAQALQCMFQLKWKASTVTGIASGVVLADLYLVPKIDASHLATIDATSGAGFIPSAYRYGSFVNALASPSASTDYYAATAWFDLGPTLYEVYLVNRSGQTLTIDDVSYFAADAQAN